LKGDKDGALDKANTLEQKVAEQKSVNEKVSATDYDTMRYEVLF